MSATVHKAAILDLLSAIGPAAIDLYLPALPGLERDLTTSVAGAQTTLSVYLLAFGVAQLFYGPLADRFGRKMPLRAGLALFALGSIGCALAPGIGWPTAMRFVQGCEGAAVTVVPLAIVRDLLTGPQATRLVATMMLVVSISPMPAPLAGSALITLGDWLLLFAVLAGAGLLALVFAGPGTLPVIVSALFFANACLSPRAMPEPLRPGSHRAVMARSFR